LAEVEIEGLKEENEVKMRDLFTKLDSSDRKIQKISNFKNFRGKT